MDRWRLGKVLPLALEKTRGHRTVTDFANFGHWLGHLLLC